MGQRNPLADQTQKPRRFYGYYVAGTSMLIYFFTNGIMLFIPPNLFPRLMEEFQATEAEVSWTSSISHLVIIPLAPLVGYLVLFLNNDLGVIIINGFLKSRCI